MEKKLMSKKWEWDGRQIWLNFNHTKASKIDLNGRILCDLI